jgi:hypothetical protein
MSISPVGPRFDYPDPADVGGQTSTQPAGTDSQGFKYESTFAYTSCSQWSGVNARVDPAGFLDDFATGSYIGALIFMRRSSWSYVSISQQQGIRYSGQVGVHVTTTHTCEIPDSNGEFPYKTTNGFTVI